MLDNSELDDCDELLTTLGAFPLGDPYIACTETFVAPETFAAFVFAESPQSPTPPQPSNCIEPLDDELEEPSTAVEEMIPLVAVDPPVAPHPVSDLAVVKRRYLEHYWLP